MKGIICNSRRQEKVAAGKIDLRGRIQSLPPPFFDLVPFLLFRPRPETPKNAWKGKYTYAGWKSPSQLENAENGENRCQIPDASYRSAKERVGSW